MSQMTESYHNKTLKTRKKGKLTHGKAQNPRMMTNVT